jgi:hypothetical protein
MLQVVDPYAYISENVFVDESRAEKGRVTVNQTNNEKL